MQRKIATLTLAAIALLGLAGCSSDSETASTEETSAPAPETSAPAETTEPAESTDLDDSAIQACLDIAEPVQEANAALLEKLTDGETAPQDVVDMYTDLADSIGKIAETTSSSTLEHAATVAHTDFLALRDAMQKVYVEGDNGAMSDFTAATTAAQESYSELLKICSPTE